MKNTPLKNDYLSVTMPTGMRPELEAHAASLGMKLGPYITAVLCYALKQRWKPRTIVKVERVKLQSVQVQRK